MRQYLTLLFIIILAFVLRVYQVDSVPPALNWDEVSIAYNSYSILKTGRDEWGQFLPIHFKAFGEYKLPIQIYASIPGIVIFGLNELGVRITPIVYGTLTILILYFLTFELTQSRKISLLSSFFLAISPWHIQLTRASFESSFATFWIVLSIWLFVKAFKKPQFLILSVVSFVISIYTYNSARIFAPIFLTLTLIYYRKDLKQRKYLIYSVLTFFILLIPLALFTLKGDLSARYKLVSITDDPGLRLRVNENRGNSKLPEPLPLLIHNKFSYTLYYTSSNFLAHFTPEFLFISGAPHKQHHVQNVGQLYLFQAPLFLAGIYLLIFHNLKFRGLLIIWIAVAHIPVSLTQDSIPHALRTLLVAPAYQIISGLGAAYLLGLLKNLKPILNYILLTLAVSVIVFSVGRYLADYHLNYPILYSRDWQYGYKQAVEYIKQNQDQYDLVVFTRHYGEPHIFTLFFQGIDPYKYQTDPSLIRFETYDWVRVLRFERYYFPDLGDKGTQFADIIKENPGKKLLFIGRKEDFPDDYPILARINFLNGDPVFDIVEKR